MGGEFKYVSDLVGCHYRCSLICIFIAQYSVASSGLVSIPNSSYHSEEGCVNGVSHTRTQYFTGSYRGLSSGLHDRHLGEEKEVAPGDLVIVLVATDREWITCVLLAPSFNCHNRLRPQFPPHPFT